MEDTKFMQGDLSGQEVAVKRLSKGSDQGLEELRNELVLNVGRSLRTRSGREETVKGFKSGARRTKK